MSLLPVLHAAQAVTDADGLSLPAIALVVGIGSAIASFGMLVGIQALRHRATRRRATLVAAGLLTLLAIVPSVVPYDHLWQQTGHASEHAGVHAAHCHDSPASCSVAPVTSGPGQIIGADPLIIVPAMLALLLLATIAPLSSISRRPEIRPPLALACRH